MWYLVLSRPTGEKDGRPHLDQHLAYQHKQHSAGNILFSGPTPDRTVGIIVIKAGSRQEAEAIADEDPFHAEGVRKYEMLEWEIHQVLGAGPFSMAAQAALSADHPH